MAPFIVGLLVVDGLWFTWFRSRKYRARRTPDEIASCIGAFVEGTGGKWDWDDFTSVAIEDPALDAIRLRCARLSEEFPPGQDRSYCGPEGVAVLRGIAIRLRSGAA